MLILSVSVLLLALVQWASEQNYLKERFELSLKLIINPFSNFSQLTPGGGPESTTVGLRMSNCEGMHFSKNFRVDVLSEIYFNDDRDQPLCNVGELISGWITQFRVVRFWSCKFGIRRNTPKSNLKSPSHRPWTFTPRLLLTVRKWHLEDGPPENFSSVQDLTLEEAPAVKK